MAKLTPLNPTLGPPAEGADKYFHREKVVKKFVRQLRGGGHLLLSAPRRTGKSTILKHLQKNPPEGLVILYMTVMSVDSGEAYFKALYSKLLKNSDIYKGLDGYLAKVGGTARKVVDRVRGIGADGVSFGKEDTLDYYGECERLLTELAKSPVPVAVFVDELPDAVSNIRQQNEQAAIRFLQQIRDLRQNFSDAKVQFVYTGSTGLKNVVKKLDRLDLVNDLQSVEMLPLSMTEAKTLIQRLALGFRIESPDFVIDDAVADHLLAIINWRLPYYMQIIVNGLFDHFEDQIDEDESFVITTSTVDQVLEDLVKSQSVCADYFENWQRRLKQAFDKNEHDLAVEALSHIAVNEQIEYAVFHDLAVKHKVDDHKYVLDVLQHDGYISEHNRIYGFNSFLLKKWWLNNVAN